MPGQILYVRHVGTLTNHLTFNSLMMTDFGTIAAASGQQIDNDKAYERLGRGLGFTFSSILPVSRTAGP
jgi:hypothetical protein